MRSRVTTSPTNRCNNQQVSAKRQTTSRPWGSPPTSTFFLPIPWPISRKVRDNAKDFTSNALSTPIEVFQNNRFREGYFQANVTANRGRQEWKFGVESDNAFLHENFSYIITDPSQFDPDTPGTFSFAASRPDLEQAVFAQDLIRLGYWTINAGLRWDHYQLLLNKQAVEPRLSISRYFPSAELITHFSYDRVFQTPWSENILLSSSNAIESLDPTNFLRLPVQPSQGDYYEAGITKAFFGKLKLDANYFRRLAGNYADKINTHYNHQLSDRVSQIHHLRCGRQTRGSRLASFLRFPELLLYRGQRLVSRDRGLVFWEMTLETRNPNSADIFRIRRIGRYTFHFPVL